jgi:hypothetical protein
MLHMIILGLHFEAKPNIEDGLDYVVYALARFYLLSIISHSYVLNSARQTLSRDKLLGLEVREVQRVRIGQVSAVISCTSSQR